MLLSVLRAKRLLKGTSLSCARFFRTINIYVFITIISFRFSRRFCGSLRLFLGCLDLLIRHGSLGGSLGLKLGVSLNFCFCHRFSVRVGGHFL